MKKFFLTSFHSVIFELFQSVKQLIKTGESFGKELILNQFEICLWAVNQSEKNFQSRSWKLFWDKQFYLLTFLRISHSLAGKWIFWFCKNCFWLIKPEPLVSCSHWFFIFITFFSYKSLAKRESPHPKKSSTVTMTHFMNSKRVGCLILILTFFLRNWYTYLNIVPS